MKIPIWIHNVHDYARSSLPADDSLIPMLAAIGKTNDGTRWQGDWDSHDMAMRDLRSVVRAERDIYGPQGIDYIPWGVIHGRWESGFPGSGDSESVAAAEGILAGKIAIAAAADGQPPVYVVDLEPAYHAPFPAFWRNDLGAGEDEVYTFILEFQQETDGKGKLWLAVDARGSHLANVSFARWLEWPDTVDRILPMVYFMDFVRPRTPTFRDIDEAYAAMFATISAAAGPGALPWEVSPILPGDASPEAMLYAIGGAHALGCSGVSIWQRLNLRVDTADAIAGLDDPWATPASTPPITLGGLAHDLDQIEGATTTIDAELGLIREVVMNIRKQLGEQSGGTP